MKPAISSPHSALAFILSHPDGGRSARERGRAYLRREMEDREADLALDVRVQEAEHTLDTLGWRFVLTSDNEMPEGVSALADPPLALFVRGALPKGPAVAIVGSRHASSYGREVAEHLGRELAAAGVTVVSGMARGVDAAAHRGALAASGSTVAVWGAGPDRVYPPEHGALAEEIAQTGALVSEYPPGSPPLAAHFPERNRIIVGLCRLVVVVEAAERSGALITARLALEEGREVMAVPGSIFSRLSAGPNGLLRAGAAPALTASDVLAVLGVPERGSVQGEELPPLLSSLPPGEAMSADELAARGGQPIAAVLEALLAGELAGQVVRESDGRYRRNRARKPSECRS